jgi:hypothetical protein
VIWVGRRWSKLSCHVVLTKILEKSMVDSSKLKLLIELPFDEDVNFRGKVRVLRDKAIPSATVLVNETITQNKWMLDNLLKTGNISEAIHRLREGSYHLFLEAEAKFNVDIVNYIGQHVETPRKILEAIIEEKLPDSAKMSQIRESVQSICGEYAGRIMPYIYIICQSNTQSRRSRAGQVFEQIIYSMYNLYEYPFDSQQKLGRDHFQKVGLGKKVDSVLPGIKEFETRRDKVIIGTMKTTLRERWQEVVEEIERTRIPKIYLLTADDDIARSKALEMGKHNIVLVVYKSVKDTEDLRDLLNIISFEQYFLQEVPNELSFWGK